MWRASSVKSLTGSLDRSLIFAIKFSVLPTHCVMCSPTRVEISECSLRRVLIKAR